MATKDSRLALAAALDYLKGHPNASPDCQHAILVRKSMQNPALRSFVGIVIEALEPADDDQATAYDPNTIYRPTENATTELEHIRCQVGEPPRRFGCQLTPFQRGMREQLSWAAGESSVGTEVLIACAMLDREFASKTTLPIFSFENAPTAPQPLQPIQKPSRAQTLLGIKFIDYQLAQLGMVECDDHDHERLDLASALATVRSAYAMSVCGAEPARTVQTHLHGWAPSRKRPRPEQGKEGRKRAKPT